MDWTTLYETQRELDTYITNNHQLADKDLFNKKYLALLVELGELANETRTFKFWSTKNRNDPSAILEEYVDGLHFILSLGIDKGYYFNGSVEKNPNKISETDQFNALFGQCVAFKNLQSKENYQELFIQFLRLGNLLGFNETEIQAAYFKKNERNFARQDEGY